MSLICFNFSHHIESNTSKEMNMNKSSFIQTITVCEVIVFRSATIAMSLSCRFQVNHALLLSGHYTIFN